MTQLNIVVETPLSRSGRVRQIEAMFDVPPSEVARISWSGDVPIDVRPWSVGLITGPSGSGKTNCLRALFDLGEPLTWNAASVLDDFASTHSIERIASVCQAVGFNTIPAWLRPFRVLSMGEQFRATLARTLLDATTDPIVMDEFTSVVDRQVAQIGAYAVQRYVRANGLRFVAATCHGDVEDWLQPDWVFEPATMTFRWRSLQGRPSLNAVIQRVPHSTWAAFAPFHYLTPTLKTSARCFVLFVNDQPAAFAGIGVMPHPQVRDIRTCSRLVTLPDWQGLGLMPRLVDTLAAMYKALGLRLRNYPSHPSYIRSIAKSSLWACVKLPGTFSAVTHARRRIRSTLPKSTGGSACAVFEYRGPAWLDVEQARALLTTPPVESIRFARRRSSRTTI